MDLSENPAELTREDLEKLTWIAVNGPEEKPNPPEKGLLKSSGVSSEGFPDKLTGSMERLTPLV